MSYGKDGEFYKNGVVLINDERNRQTGKNKELGQEGYDNVHDDKHVDGELAAAAIAYICFYGANFHLGLQPEDALEEALEFWPWESDEPNDQMKPEKDPVHNLVKAGALIAAEIDRLQRLKSINEDIVESGETE